MMRRTLSVMSMLAMLFSFSPLVQAAVHPALLNLKFTTYAQARFPIQDVFVLSPMDQTKVMRVQAKDALFKSNLNQPAYAAATAIPHDLSATTPMITFDAGK